MELETVPKTAVTLKIFPTLANCSNPLNYFSDLKIINTYYRINMQRINSETTEDIFLMNNYVIHI